MPCEPSDRLRSRDPYRLVDGLYVPPWPVLHRSENYEASHLAMLRDMEDRHFWYRGRHRFLLHAVHAELGRARAEAGSPRLIDLGGGCGGWLRYLLANKRFSVAEAALGDSSTTALEHARERLPSEVGLYHLDLLGLRWNERWELAFLLDVLEHIPEDGKVLSEVYRSLCPGGVLFVTVPALERFLDLERRGGPASTALRQAHNEPVGSRSWVHDSRVPLLHVLSQSPVARRALVRQTTRSTADARSDERAPVSSPSHAIPAGQRATLAGVRRRDAPGTRTVAALGYVPPGGLAEAILI